MPVVSTDDIDNKLVGNLILEASSMGQIKIFLGHLLISDDKNKPYHSLFTWFNNRNPPTFEKLDRFLKLGATNKECAISEEDKCFLTAPFTEIEVKHVFGFIKGRYILDGVVALHEIIHEGLGGCGCACLHEILIPLYMLSLFWAPKEDAMAGEKKNNKPHLNREGLWQKIVRNKGTRISGRAFWKDNVICGAGGATSHLNLHLYIVLDWMSGGSFLAMMLLSRDWSTFALVHTKPILDEYEDNDDD
ncbi:hypothetical protein ACJX0J_036880 [Zea mays]